MDEGWKRVSKDGPVCIQVGCGWVGTAMFTLILGLGVAD